MEQIYLDFNASTPIAPEVREAMQPYLASAYGNPSSTHWAGRPGREAVENARAQVADLLGCTPGEVVFTSGGTEANNHALKGVFYAKGGRGHIITTAVEHPAIIEPCRFLERLGAKLTVLPVDSTGLVDPAAVEAAITEDTILVSVMHANNEMGTIEPITQIADVCRASGVLLHTDAAQSVGKIPTRV
ncbi:MAG: aminotransferase class V-fold PLP-dependent enzyme, partial [Actinomycetota bacterium]|nr:aminotransferase class V-fold PLP-dependent enzyme [Actinomycetota bacterium]